MANVSVEDDEPDYMSDDFLAKCIPEDVRPGLKRVNINSVQNIIFSIDGLTEVIKLKYLYTRIYPNIASCFSHTKINVNMIYIKRRVTWWKEIEKTKRLVFPKILLKFKTEKQVFKKALIRQTKDLKCSRKWAIRKVR